MDILADARQAWVEFRARPWVSAVAVVTLALGIAGATTMFTTLSGVSAAMVPPDVDASRVGRVTWAYADGSNRSEVTAEEYAQLRRSLPIFETLCAWAGQTVVLGGEGGPVVSVMRVSPEFFPALGFKTAAGRLFTADDTRAGSARVAIVREGARTRLGNLELGRVVRLGGDDYTVVGIVPDRCWYPMPGTDIWLPMEMSRDGVPAVASVWATARLRNADPQTLQLARSQVAAVGARFARAAGSAGSGRRLLLITLQADVGQRIGFGLVGLLGPAVVVLLITCGNVANLLLARAKRREREMAVRAALGASRMRLVRERLAESALLGGLGGLLGLALAFAGVRLLRFWVGSFSEQTRSAADAIRLDPTALLFAVLVTLAVPLVFGLVPALVASKPSLTPSLHAAPASKKPRRGPYGGRDVLVIVQVGLAVVLVVCAVMFSRFFTRFADIRYGFDQSKVIAVGLSLAERPSAQAANARLLTDVIDAVQQVPGVRAAAAGGVPFVQMAWRNRARIEFKDCASASAGSAAYDMGVGPGYFAALGLPVRRGRGISSVDTAGSEPVAVLSERLAVRCWPGQDPIGQHVRRASDANSRWLTVVGVVPDTMVSRAFPDAPQAVYVPYAQTDGVPGAFVVTSDRDPAALVDRIRAVVRRVDPTQPVNSVARADDKVREVAGGGTLFIGVLGGFGGFALALGMLGVFSVTSYMVAERTREFGVRIALGAPRRAVMRLVLKQALIIVGIGTAVSFAGTLAVTHVGFREMGDLAMTDPILWASVCFLLVAVAIGAAILPAQRAMRVEPMVALRAE